MLSMRSLPKVVKATRTHSTSSVETSVSEGELLVVKSTKSKLTGRVNSEEGVIIRMCYEISMRL